MKFELFKEGLNALKEMNRYENNVNSFFKSNSEDFIFIPKATTRNYIEKTLWSWSDIPDAQDILEYYIWEMDFGNKWREYYIQLTNGEYIDISTPESLYEYLKGNDIYLSEDKVKELKI